MGVLNIFKAKSKYFTDKSGIEADPLSRGGESASKLDDISEDFILSLELNLCSDNEKLCMIIMIVTQFDFQGSDIYSGSDVKIHRCHYSYIYILCPLRYVVLLKLLKFNGEKKIRWSLISIAAYGHTHIRIHDCGMRVSNSRFVNVCLHCSPIIELLAKFYPIFYWDQSCEKR